jgi:hypothetical protein
MREQSKDPGQEELLKEITTLLTKEKIPYMITGSVSVIFYGRPRASHDIDFIIEASSNDLLKIQTAFEKLPHKEFITDPYLIETAIENKMQFNVLHLPTMLKLDFWILQDTEFDKERFKRKKFIDIFGQKMAFASPEDTILIKLLWYKESKIEKHLIDAAFVYQLQKESLDHRYLDKWVKKQKTVKTLNELENIDLVEHY